MDLGLADSGPRTPMIDGTQPARTQPTAHPAQHPYIPAQRGNLACGHCAARNSPAGPVCRERPLGAVLQAGKACWSRTAISFSTSDAGRGWPVLKRRAPDEAE